MISNKLFLVVLSLFCGLRSLCSAKGFQLSLTRCEKRTVLNDETREERIENRRIEEVVQSVGNAAEVCRLRLSHGNISFLPNGLFKNFTSLIELSLAENNIKTIEANAFVGLSSLKTLDLSENPVQEWNTSGILSHIPRLTSLDMTSLPLPWKKQLIPTSPRRPSLCKPATSLLLLPHLIEIKGASWSRLCSNCSLLRTTNTTQLSFYGNESSRFIKEYACRSKTTTPSAFLRNLAKYGFLATCVLSNRECFKSEVKVVVMAPCRDTTLGVMGLQYILGPAAIVLNLVVIGTVINSKRLRHNNDMLLVTNIAIGDLSNGLYSLIIVSIHQTRTFSQMELFAVDYCAYVGLFWILGLSLSVSFSLVLTIERFKCVVRQSRMSALEVLLASLVCWVLSLCATILPGFGIGNYHLNTYCISVFPTKTIPVQLYYSLTIAGTGAAMYLISIPIYLKMYIFVRKSSKNMRVRADIELAKRVFTLVMTNMVFFLLPIIISLVFARVERNTSKLSREVSEVLNAALPLVCLTMNSVLNPILYSFRSRLFRKEVSSWPCRIHPTTDRSSSFKLGTTRSAYVLQKRENTQNGTSLSSL